MYKYKYSWITVHYSSHVHTCILVLPLLGFYRLKEHTWLSITFSVIEGLFLTVPPTMKAGLLAPSLCQSICPSMSLSVTFSVICKSMLNQFCSDFAHRLYILKMCTSYYGIILLFFLCILSMLNLAIFRAVYATKHVEDTYLLTNDGYAGPDMYWSSCIFHRVFFIKYFSSSACRNVL